MNPHSLDTCAMPESRVQSSKPVGGDALVTFTLLRNAEDFIQRRELSVKCLFDLSALVDSIIIGRRTPYHQVVAS